ncbi:hypothetical protein [Nocardia gipuzkoensis]|uniref:hypothetical protein n=1 Tax=Nocardia gipuzkoensis TaxID=2749991 RepID=UPI0015EEEC56|nr:hypothetical protein [Nocardia gipuzkoensis]
MTFEQVVFIDDVQLALDGVAEVAMTAIKTDNTTTIAELNRLLDSGARTENLPGFLTLAAALTGYKKLAMTKPAT